MIGHDRRAMSSTEWVRKLSEALREHDVLEPWLTESHWDERYWDDIAGAVADNVGPRPGHAEVVAALRAEFGELVSNNGLFRDQLERRLHLIADRVSRPCW
jgi:hypothetical protein